MDSKLQLYRGILEEIGVHKNLLTAGIMVKNGNLIPLPPSDFGSLVLRPDLHKFADFVFVALSIRRKPGKRKIRPDIETRKLPHS